MSRPRTVMVTGASGVIGSRLVDSLRLGGWRVRALAHRRPVPAGAEGVRGDLELPESLRDAVDGVDAIVHAAGVTHARRAANYEATNVTGTENLLSAWRDTGGGRFLYLSSRAISPQGGAYSRSKRRAEAAVRAAAADHVIVRLPEVFGGSSAEGVDELIARARRGAPLPIVGRGADLVCPIHIDDAVAAVGAALEAEGGRTYTLAGECMTVRELAERCRLAFGSSSSIRAIPRSLFAAASQLSRIAPIPIYPDQLARLESSKPTASADAAAELGFDPRSLEECLESLAGAGRKER